MAENYDLSIDQGATFRRTCTWTNSDTGLPINIASATVSGMIRKNFSDTAALVSFTCAVIDGANGVFTFSLTPVQTAALPATGKAFGNNEVYHYDIEILLVDTTITRVLQGNVTVNPEATK
jgi:hypothetical protein